MGHGATVLFLAWMGWLLQAPPPLVPLPGTATPTTVTVETVIRSGPGEFYYPTMKVRVGTVLEVYRVANGWAEIAPPPGSFSLVPAELVRRTNLREGTVLKGGTETLMGSELVPDARQVGARLPLGQLVQIVDQVIVNSARGPQEYYKILPEGERRFIAAAAFAQPESEIQQTQLQMAAGNQWQGPPPELPASVMASVQSAEQAYRRAEVSGDWRQAKQLYQELERSPLHHVRTTAQNRLEFIRQREGQPAPGPLPTGSNGGVGGMAGHRHDLYAGSWRPSTGEPRPGMNPGMQPGMAARTTMPPAGSPGTTWDRAASSGLPPEAPAPVQQPAVARPVNAPAAPRSVTPAPELAGVSRQPTIGPKWTPGLLRQAYQNLGGQPLFYLMDTNDQLKCFVSPGPGTDLRPFVNRNVEVMGGLLLPRVDLGNKPHMTVTAVRPLP